MAEEEQETFYLGFTLAGSVSAGCYTGGVLDYLFEVLDKWEKAKKGDLQGVDSKDVPMHNVVIDVLGGTSGGGMTASMAALYALRNKINPVTDEVADKVGGNRGNIFYDSWVNLVDEADQKTIEKALSITDLQKDGVIRSLLNSEFLDKIADKALNFEVDPSLDPLKKMPAYVSKNLELLISHSMLRGIPLGVKFSNNSTLTNPPTHYTYEHFLMSHFKLNYGNPVNEDCYMWLNPYNDKFNKQLKLATVATGAFPLGLIYRSFDNEHFNSEYLKTIVSRLISGEMGEAQPQIKQDIVWQDDLLKYNSLSVDGGAINNEPYREVLSILKHNHGKSTIVIKDEEYQKYGMVMIDPFPDFYNANEEYNTPSNLLEIAIKVVKMLWNQSKIKRKEMIDQFNDKAYRGVIFPKKHKIVNNQKVGEYSNPIATGLISGFSGFLDIKFRHHDFYLGRNNARNFVRAFLSLPYNDGTNGQKVFIHPIHSNWTSEQIKKYLITMDDLTYLPIIPDMNMLLENVDSGSQRNKYTFPDPPIVNIVAINNLSKPIEARLKEIAKILIYSFEFKKRSFFGRFLNLKIGKSILLFSINKLFLRDLGQKAIISINNELKKLNIVINKKND